MLFSANELYYAILCYPVHLHICCVACWVCYMLILAIFIHQKRSTSVKVMILRIELILVKLPVEWSCRRCSVVCFSFIFPLRRMFYFLWEELSTSVIILICEYLIVKYLYSIINIVIVCLGWFLDEGLTHM